MYSVQNKKVSALKFFFFFFVNTCRKIPKLQSIIGPLPEGGFFKFVLVLLLVLKTFEIQHFCNSQDNPGWDYLDD